MQKNLDYYQINTGLVNDLHFYRLETLWMALNQENYKRFTLSKNNEEKQTLLNTLLRNNLLSFFKGVNVWLEAPLLAKGVFTEHVTQFKNQPMLAFKGEFMTNALLPDFIGLGKAVSRGFGTISGKK